MRSKGCLCAFAGALFIFVAANAPCANAAPPTDACSLLTQAQVTAALGLAVDAGTHPTPKNSHACEWAESNASVFERKTVTVRLIAADAYDSSRKLMEATAAQMKDDKDEQDDASQLTVTPVSGLGDDAYYAAMGAHPNLNVKKGSLAFAVEIFGEIPRDKIKAIEKTLATQILSKL